MKVDPKVHYMRLVTVIMGMETHLKFKGKMRLTRTATPARLRNIATEYTGKQYPRSRQGMETALVDLRLVKEDMLQALQQQPA